MGLRGPDHLLERGDLMRPDRLSGFHLDRANDHGEVEEERAPRAPEHSQMLDGASSRLGRTP